MLYLIFVNQKKLMSKNVINSFFGIDVGGKIKELKEDKRLSIIRENKEKSNNIIKKWQILQNKIKEGITLEEIILKQQEDDFQAMKDLFVQYYEAKIKLRDQNETMKTIEQDRKKKKLEYQINKNGESILQTSYDFIRNLFFLFREDPKYIVKLVSLIEETDDTEKIDSLVELFCNQFYDNIIIPDQEEEEILILLYQLIENEITQMNSATIDDFLNDNTFVGKLISCYMNKTQLNNFLRTVLKSLILSIENVSKDCKDLSLNNLNKEILKNKNNDKKPDVPFEKYLGKITKTSIHIKDEQDDWGDTIEEEFNDEENTNNQNYNLDYKDELNLDKLYKLIQNEQDQDKKDLYSYQLEQIGNDEEIFTNLGLKLILNEPYFKNNKSNILEAYFENFKFIKEKIDILIQSLIDKVNLIPYNVRCISKVVSILIHKKFPQLPKFLRNSFIGKIILDKCIFLVLGLDNNNIIESMIFSSNTKKCLNVIISVLSNANKCYLYPTTIDTEKTIFNYYLLEIIPILNKFYEKLIDIKLPKNIEQLLSKIQLQLEQQEDKKIFTFRRNNKMKPKSEKKENEEKGETITDQEYVLLLRSLKI